MAVIDWLAADLWLVDQLVLEAGTIEAGGGLQSIIKPLPAQTPSSQASIHIIADLQSGGDISTDMTNDVPNQYSFHTGF